MQFKDLLRRQSDLEQDAAESAEKPEPGKSVVIAEGERAARETIAAQVLDLGYVPLIATDGDSVIEMAREYQPRLVIANLDLEGPSGSQMLDALRDADATRDIPVMLISNTDKTPDMVVGSQVGADDYICKPIDGAEVRARIRELLFKTSEDVPTPPPRPAAPPPSEEPGETPEEIPAEPVVQPDRPPAAGDALSPAEHIEQGEAVYAECCDFAKDAMDRSKRSEPPDVDWCRGLAGRLVEQCEDRNRLLLKAIRGYQPGESFHDAVNVAVFSIKIGQGLKYDRDELTALAMAALCHEIGMSRVPPDVAAAEGRYSKKQRNEIRQHPEHARRILSDLGEEYHWLAEAVYQEHERERGQGYPQGLKGDEICEFAKIIGLADTYESLSHRRSFRKAFIAFDALREVIGMRNKYFAPHIIRALVSEVSVFPLESYVLLNTGETARVAKTNPDNLLRPMVIVEYDGAGQKLRRTKRIDLASKPLIYVTKPVDERDLAK